MQDFYFLRLSDNTCCKTVSESAEQKGNTKLVFG